MANTKLNSYYRRDLVKLYDFLYPKKVSKLVLKRESIIPKRKYEFIILDNLIGDIPDVQNYFKKIQPLTKSQTRIIISYYNHLWEPVLKLGSRVGLRKVKHEQNWLDQKDINSLLELEGFDLVSHRQRLLIPIYIPILSKFINKWVAPLPIINSLCLTTWSVARPKVNDITDYTVSIIVPARNEKGNIRKIVKSIPRFGKLQEIIFVEGHSADNTWSAIGKELKKKHRKNLKVKAYKQKGVGKADAVRLGFKKAKGDILMILDADLTVNPKDLKKFYVALSTGKGEFINGSRLVYPMEKDAMRSLNKIGNKVFSWIFTWILGQRFKDTLCGTKALFRSDYEWISKNRKYFSEEDPFGDFDLIFGAVKKNLKVVEIPVRYKERAYGSTNISRFRHGLQLAKMTWVAYRKFKAW